MNEYLMQKETLSVRDWTVDALIALAAFGFACLQLTQAINLLIPDEVLRRFIGVEALIPSAYSILAVAVTTIPLVLRRKFPWLVLLVVLISWMFFQSWLGMVSVSLVGPLIALFTVASLRSRAEAAIAGIVVGLLVMVAPTTGNPPLLAQMTLLQNLALVAAAALAGYALHARQDYVQATEERARAAEQSRESEAQRRVEEERVRIAREVHDITAHSLSAVSIQAAAAERLMEKDPAAAQEAIATARQTAKTALEDIRAMIGVLRTGNEKAESQPTEGTDHLSDLVSYLKSAGVDAVLDDGQYQRSRVPLHVDVALFGIAREATTNIVRHAQAHHARITLFTTQPMPVANTSSTMGQQSVVGAGFPASAAFRPMSSSPAAHLIVEDDGMGVSKAAGQSHSSGGLTGNGSPASPIDAFKDSSDVQKGHGIEGMRERVRLLNGEFSAQTKPEGGFLITVSIPLP